MCSVTQLSRGESELQLGSMLLQQSGGGTNGSTTMAATPPPPPPPQPPPPPLLPGSPLLTGGAFNAGFHLDSPPPIATSSVGGGQFPRPRSTVSTSLLDSPVLVQTPMSATAAGCELWRDCARWLVELGILDGSSTASKQLPDFAALLRDGVVLCELANVLRAGSVSVLDIQLRPAGSQFLCLKNITLFVAACRDCFGLPPHQMFDALELYKLSDFGRVLKTLALLSQCDVARAKGVRPFGTRASFVEYTNNSAIYRNLGGEDDELDETADASTSRDLTYRTLTSGAAHAADAGIYDTIVCRRHSLNEQRQDKWTLFSPDTKRGHCIKELLDTEQNYVEKALNMLIHKFYTPLKRTLAADDHSTIFMNIVDIWTLHQAFSADLRRAVLHTLQLTEPGEMIAPNKATIGDVFLCHKARFVVYGPYCAGLDAARTRIEKSSDAVKKEIANCAANAAESNFRLQDILTIPMQRVLKYHLLLQELLKHTAVDSLDRHALDRARESMQEINDYVNEVKRDTEAKALISEIEASISSLEMPEGMRLYDYGRMHMDDELRVADSSAAEPTKPKPRHIFIFDRVLLICKNTRNNQLSFKGAHALTSMRIVVDEDGKFGTITKKLSPGAPWAFTLEDTRPPVVDQNGESLERSTVTFYCKTESGRNKWIDAFRKAIDNCAPSVARDHQLVYTTFEQPTCCAFCQKLLCGLFFQGYTCKDCKVAVHKQCASLQSCSNVQAMLALHASASSSSSQHSTAASSPNGPLTQLQQQPHALRQSRASFVQYEPGDVVTAVRNHMAVDAQHLSLARDDQLEVVAVREDGLLVASLLPARSLQGLVRPELVRRARVIGAARVTSMRLPRHVHREMGAASAGNGHANNGVNNNNNNNGSNGSVYVNTAVAEQSWFHGDQTREYAEALLRLTPNGTFLVRYSANKGAYALSISYANDVKHTVIQHADEKYYLDEATVFGSVVELIDYYRANNLRESFHALDTTLTKCSAELERYLALHDYIGEEERYLSLHKGDVVTLMDKTGECRGWWRGAIGTRIGFFPLKYVAPIDETGVVLRNSRTTAATNASAQRN